MANPTSVSAEPTLLEAIDMVAKEKGIDRERLVKSVEEAFVKAAQSVFGATRDFEARLNPDTGRIDLTQYVQVVDDPSDEDREISVEEAAEVGLTTKIGEELGFQIFWHPSDAKKALKQDQEYGDLLRIKQARSQFGRIAAQAAKQVLVQRVRDEERDLVYQEFKDKKGELIRGVVRRSEKQNLIVDLGRAEAILPAREQVRRDAYRPGDRIVAYLKDIDREARGPQVILSRTDARLVEKLFEAEVPEIYEGIVKIMSCAREAGERTKIAVASRDPDIDPVGACVGMKGARVQAVVQELRTEKIDIVLWDRDPARFVCEAIKPAEVLKVIVEEGRSRMELVVPDEKLSLAIGRKGQNVRLASELTGWKLDIISDSKFRQMEEEAIIELQQVDQISEAIARSMYRMGFRALDELAEAVDEELMSVPGLGDANSAQAIRKAAEQAVERQREQHLSAAREKAKQEPLSEHERLLCVRGVSERVAQILEEAGFKTVEDLADEDEERIASKSRLGSKKARIVKQGAVQFLDQEDDLFAHDAS